MVKKIIIFAVNLLLIFYLSACNSLELADVRTMEQTSIIYVRLEDYQELLDRYSWILFEYPDRELSRINRSAVYNKTGLFYEALEDAMYVKNQNLSVEENLINLNNAKAGISNFPDRIETYNQAIKKYPKCAFPYLYRGKFLIGTGNYDEALKDLECAKDYLSKSSFFYRITLFYIGYTFSLKEDYKSASRNYEYVSNYFEKWPYYAYEISNSFYENMEYKRALKIINKTIKVVSDEKDFYILRFKIYMKLNNLKDAYNDLNRIIELSPNESEYYKKSQIQLLELMK